MKLIILNGTNNQRYKVNPNNIAYLEETLDGTIVASSAQPILNVKENLTEIESLIQRADNL